MALTAYQKFVKRQMKAGKTMKQTARLWKSAKKTSKPKRKKIKKTVAKRTVRRITMPKRRRKSYRRKSNPMGSYSKSNIAIGTLMGQIAPKFLPGSSAWLPLAALLPKAPTALKIMGLMVASKVVSDRFINR